MHDHAVRDRVYACRSKTAGPFYFYNTDPACAFLSQFRVVAELRDVYAGDLGSLDHCIAARYGYRLIIYSYLYQFHLFSLLSTRINRG